MGNGTFNQAKDTPEVIFDKENKVFQISGNSYPENCEKIYEPIKLFLDEYKVISDEELNFEFKFNLINSTSTVYLVQIIMKIAQLSEKGLNISISWQYDNYDEELLELGEKLATISNLPFTYVPIHD